MPMNTKSMGEKLRAYRAACGWTIKDCAEKIGISTRYLADIERGDKVPKMETFVRMVNILQASADDVLQDSLVVGYEVKSNDLLKRLESLAPVKRKQALEILDSVITSLEE